MASIKTELQAIRETMTGIELRQQQRFEAQEKALAKAEVATEKRFDGVNEFRQTLTDQAGTFALKAQVDVQIKALESKMDTQFKSLDNKIDVLAGLASTGVGRSVGLNAAWGYILSGVMALVAVAAFFLK